MSDIEGGSDLDVHFGTNAVSHQEESEEEKIPSNGESSSDEMKNDDEENSRDQTTHMEDVNDLFNDDEDSSDEDDNDIVRPPQHFVVSTHTKPSDSALNILCLSDLFGFESEPFDPDTYNYAEEKKALQESRNQAREFCMLRWRWKHDEHGNIMKDDQGRALRESNAHIVEWEDGSQDLYVGDNIIRLKVVNDATNSQCLFVNQQAEQVYIPGKYESWYESHGYVENKVLTGAIHVPKRDQYLKERGDDHAVHTRILPDYMKKQEKKKTAKQSRPKRQTGLNSSFLESTPEENNDGVDLKELKRSSKTGPLNRYKHRQSDDYSDSNEYQPNEDDGKERNDSLSSY